MANTSFHAFTRFSAVVASGLATICAIGTAAAQTTLAQAGRPFPEPGKRITMIVPYAPGGGVDYAARLMSADLQAELGVPVVVDNRPGAGAKLGLSSLVRSAPDGYTLSYAVFPTIITHYMEPGEMPPYDRKNFQPIGQHFKSPYAIAVAVNSKFRTLRELVEAARVKPEAISISDSGSMASPHLTVAMLGLAAGVKFLSVHYNGGAPSLTALLSGEVDAFAGGGSDTVPYIANNQLRVLGVAAEKEDPMMPGVPTMKSQGYDVINDSLAGVVAPAGTPKEAVDRLTQAMKKAINNPEHAGKMTARGNIPYYMDPTEMTQFWEDFERRLAPVLPPLFAAQK